MKNIIIQFCFSILLLFLCLSFLSAQVRYDPGGVIRGQLMGLIQARYGSDYQNVGYTIFDSLILYSSIDMENVQDPYGTLAGCVLFSTYKEYGESVPDTFIVGIVKNGQIIWDNALGSSADLGGDLLYAQDINNDGEVDFLFSETDRENLQIGRPPFLCYLNILSWNGSSGRFINAIKSDGKSAIMGDGSFELMDKSGDNIQEIRSSLLDIGEDWGDYKTNYYPYITYGWNGSQYGFWAGVEQINGNEYLPANRISANIRCYLQKESSDLTYNYVVNSDTSSKQNISDIYIGGVDDTSANLAPVLWQSGSSSYVGGRAFIKYSRGTYYLIHPGQTLGGFKTVSQLLPAIVKFYIQGYTAPIFGTDEEETQNILTNSVTGYTLGTSDTTQSFIPLAFLDTLSFYTIQFDTLGWIKDSLTANKYLGYFSTTRTSVQRGDSISAHAALQQVLNDVDVDSTTNLTSEAYALLRFNTEYLIQRLPAQRQPDTLTVPGMYAAIQSAINIADSGRVILVSAGTYNELDSINNKNSLRLSAVDTNVNVQGFIISNSTNITIKGFKINASGTSQDGIQLAGTQNSKITLEANEIQNSSKNGIAAGQNNDSLNIVNNVIANNSLDGISFTAGATGTQFIVNNTIVKNSKCGIEAVGPQKLLIVNNIVIYDTLAGRSGERLVRGAGTAYIMQKNNLVLKQQDGVIQSNYRLVSGSPAIDKGTTNFTPLPVKDKAGNPRISGTTIDVGAYEYQQ